LLVLPSSSCCCSSGAAFALLLPAASTTTTRSARPCRGRSSSLASLIEGEKVLASLALRRPNLCRMARASGARASRHLIRSPAPSASFSRSLSRSVCEILVESNDARFVVACSLGGIGVGRSREWHLPDQCH